MQDLLDEGDRDDRERRFHATEALIDEAITRIGSPQYRRAAQHLLGSGPARWRPLSRRGADAGAVFGVGWDAFRRDRPDVPSLRDETLLALAEQLTPKPPGSAADDSAAAEPDGAPGGALSPGRWRRRGAVLGLALVVLVPAAIMVRHEDQSPAVECFGLIHRPGDVASGASTNLTRWAEPFASAADIVALARP